METRSFVVLTTHKAGSMLLFRMLEHLSKMMRRPLVSDNLGTPPWNKYAEFRDKIYDGYLFGPLRTISIFNDADFSRLDTICHMRDPRDVLTSYYFSMMYSHNRNPDVDARAKRFTEIGIDAAVVETAELFFKRYMIYVETHKTWGFPILTYEEMVTDYPRWLDKFLQYFPPTIIPNARKYFIEQFEWTFNVKVENVREHRRRVTPGDHKEKLKPETIRQLNGIFAPVLEYFGYAEPASHSAAAE